MGKGTQEEKKERGVANFRLHALQGLLITNTFGKLGAMAWGK